MNIKKGSLTDKGIVDKIVYLNFHGDTPTGDYSDKPKYGYMGGLTCAQIGTKAYPIGELKLITNG